MSPLAPWLLAAWAVGIAAWDWRARRVPNGAVAAAALGAVALLAVFGHGVLGAGWAMSLAGAALGAGLWLPGYFAKKVGAGDVKFAACIGLLLGIPATIEAMLLAALLLGMMATAAVACGRRHARLPAAVALAGGMLLRLFWGAIWVG